ncbi:hypothetical protein DACRYDRAFT_16345 [Dacryopinax primogenitus]|uniref:Uncharacterized protein n=1 Tax=Dacryopinax primogenitus (strain DJM 731) TaxID=1858805 RepID=M5FTI5_DACPD|nr:uncharacterized protein DACRYDRAFT_16345 [Dacryopinax primogenitus]EJU00956.1 hypothetical protein DACRYDRAFT_16345 [Dacryopinax primogenitus]
MGVEADPLSLLSSQALPAPVPVEKSTSVPTEPCKLLILPPMPALAPQHRILVPSSPEVSDLSASASTCHSHVTFAPVASVARHWLASKRDDRSESSEEDEELSAALVNLCCFPVVPSGPPENMCWFPSEDAQPMQVEAMQAKMLYDHNMISAQCMFLAKDEHLQYDLTKSERDRLRHIAELESQLKDQQGSMSKGKEREH